MFGAFFVFEIIMFFVYILFSEKLSRFYVGTTDDVDKRLIEHNSIKYPDSFTAKGVPWKLALSYGCESSELAYQLEVFIKRMKSKKFIENIIDDKSIIDNIVAKF